MRGCSRLLDLFRDWDAREATLPPDDVAATLGSLDLDRRTLRAAIRFDERSYRRVTLHRTVHYEALVLCWRSGQRSAIHDHRGSSCVVRVVEGRATETRFEPSPCGLLAPVEVTRLDAGQVTACNGLCVHQMANLEPAGRDLVSLHVYSPPPSGWHYFRVDETILADNDALAARPAATLRVDLESPRRPVRPVAPRLGSLRP